MRRLSKVAPDWWDYTTLDDEILDDAARLTPQDLVGLSREGFTVVILDTADPTVVSLQVIDSIP